MEDNMFRKIAVICLLSALLPGSASLNTIQAASYPPDVAAALDSAGANRAQLEAVLSHFESEGDSLKLDAAYFLIGNMEDHSYVTFKLHDTVDTEIEFNVLDYPDFKTLLAACDTLEDIHGTLDFSKKDQIYDLKTITSEFLIKQIDLAFQAWREKPWAKDMSYECFRDYVLPYRGSGEPLEPWRSYFMLKYHGIESKMSDPSDPIEAAKLINDDVMKWFKFDERFYYHPTDQGLKEMMLNGMGRCEDMTNVTIYAFRANGLAVTSDYTPHWANSGNNHAWNSIVTLDGKVIPFMGAECSPGDYKLHNKAAKVYRKMFGKRKSNLIFQDRKQEKVPGWLAGKSYIDVTSNYVDVSDVKVTFEKEIPDSVDIAYLCVFNSGEWRAIHWARIEDGAALFTDMGTDIAYIPALYINEEIVPYGEPFILQADDTQHKLLSDTDKTIDVTVTSTTKREKAVSTDGIAKTFLTKDQEYELFYWSDGWQSIGKKAAGDKPIKFKKAPSGGLYWLVATDSDKEERIFTIEDGEQVWW